MSVAMAVVAAACGSSKSAASSGGGSAHGPFAGKTIHLISSGSAGSNHDLAARAIAPFIARYLHATVDVVDMPGGGQLKAWTYLADASPNGLTIGTSDVQGMLANYWEKVPGQKFNVAKLTYLGGMAGGAGGGSKVMFAVNAKTGPLSSIYSLLKDKTVKVRAVGSVGDVTVPLWSKVYHLPLTDLTDYPDASAELQALLRGDGQISSKTWGGSWSSFVTSGKGKVLFANTMHATWAVDPSVPTVPSILAKVPPPTAEGKAAIIANSEAEDGGLAFIGPPGMSASLASALRAAVKWAMAQPGFVSQATKSNLSTLYDSPAQEMAAVQLGMKPATVATIRKYVPLSTGVAS